MRQDKMHTLACPPKLFNAVLAQLRSLRRGIFASRQGEERRAYFVYVQTLKHSISTTPPPLTRDICVKTRRRPKCILCVCASPSTQYWHNTAPSDEGYLRQDKAVEMLTLCMCKPLNTVLAQHRSLRRGTFASRQGDGRNAYFVYVQALQRSIGTTPLPLTRDICVKTRRQPKCILCVCIRSSTPY